MDIHIHPTHGLAVYDQIVRQMKFAVANGTVAAGEFVTSVRELARILAINPNTVARAYRQLQDDEVLELIRGRGLSVKQGACGRCQLERVQLIGTRLQLVLTEALASGLDQGQVESLLQTALHASLDIS